MEKASISEIAGSLVRMRRAAMTMTSPEYYNPPLQLSLLLPVTCISPEYMSTSASTRAHSHCRRSLSAPRSFRAE
jgi:hypothetical protein